MRRLTNCLIVALSIWLKSGARHWIAVRRSVSFAGMVPHFSHVRERGRELVMVDYIPRKRKPRIISRGDSLLLFDGLYRVRRYRLESVGTGDTLRDAVRSAVATKAHADR